jgi:pimeloyl-ACP methyl ester carboxylesterase
MNKKWNLSVFTILMAGLLMAGVALAATLFDDQPDSSAYVGKGWSCFLPAFKDANGVPIPFAPPSNLPPIGYKGDYYVDEFTDAKIKQAWQELKEKDPEAARKIIDGLGFVDGKREQRVIGALDPNGVINGNDDLKLTEIRRPAFFGQAPYFEEIAKAEQDTYTVEFTVPRGYYERSQLNLFTPLKLRGWFIRGKGVLDTEGKKVHAVFIYFEGQSSQLTAIHHPDAPYCMWDIRTKQYKGVKYPNKDFQTEQWGQRQVRQYYYDFNQAGFDVLIVDKRGHGISGGVNCYECSETADDVFRMLDQLETGEGLTVLAPNGQQLKGKETAGLLLRGMSAKKVPVILGGHSDGAQVTSLTMLKNFVGWTTFNEPKPQFIPAKKDKYNFKAAILLGSSTGGSGYTPSDPDLWIYEEAAKRVEKNAVQELTSEVLANIDKWPVAVFFGNGLWDNYYSPRGVYESYRRIKGLKELVFYRGSHGFASSGAQNVAYLSNKITEFAIRALVNPDKKYPEFKSFKEAVLSSPPYWEPTSRP